MSPELRTFLGQLADDLTPLRAEIEAALDVRDELEADFTPREGQFLALEAMNRRQKEGIDRLLVRLKEQRQEIVDLRRDLVHLSEGQ